MTRVQSPLYDLTKTFEENFNHPLFFPKPPFVRPPTPPSSWTSFLGFPLRSPIGAAPCAVTTGQGIQQLADLGFDVLTYKTIRCRAQASHPLPNIVYVDCEQPLRETDLAQPLFEKKQAVQETQKIAISNSFGNSCLTPEQVQADIQLAKNSLHAGQILIVSIYGEGATARELSTDFAAAAELAKQAGADILELNLSCPNVFTQEPLYRHPELVKSVISAVIQATSLPVLVKIGWLPESYSLATLLQAVARAGAQGLSAVNSLPMWVLNSVQQPVFGKRLISGVSGYPIKDLALSFIRRLQAYNQHHHLQLAIVGMGGITAPEHFIEFLDAGADVALSATGMMWNPFLALDYHQRKFLCLH